ncbi:hypothetical protein [Ktedonospora formicarum]|uniref:Uncharacterized protein n=1 Tax=Ktedonospora formicarum TaxID=2778364 RepID=A0A8J3MT12_9CHLR|nr:hypothetical protein [Ktedonospora formicarum]GHO45163.1 hypothetical protein KSX_33260 [Ktedonospora formicarum]
MSTDPKTASTELTFQTIRNFLVTLATDLDEDGRSAVNSIRDFLEGYYWDGSDIEGMANDLGLFQTEHIDEAYRPLAVMVVNLLELLVSSKE